MLITGGAFEMAIISETSFADVDTTFQVTSIPFAFKDYDTAWEFADTTGGEFSKELFKKYGVIYLSTFPNGIMQFANNKREIRTPGDMENLKMRTYGDLQMSLMRSLGADPTQLSFSELYSALQTGAVDGNMNGYQTLWSGSLHEVQPYITALNADVYKRQSWCGPMRWWPASCACCRFWWRFSPSDAMREAISSSRSLRFRESFWIYS